VCGIAGYIGPDRSAHAHLTVALDALEHRGPDDSGTHIAGACSMGMTRLSVIDLDGGHQPLYNPENTVAVVFNGEIYNYRELRSDLRRAGHTFRTSTDTEVLVHLYEDHGPEMVHHLRGMFAFAIHDVRTGDVLLARDRFGKKPLYYIHDAGELWFGSELKAVVPWARRAGRPLPVDPQAVYDYLSLGVVPQPTTIFAGARALPPASTAHFSNGNLALSTYWAPAFHPKSGLDLPTAKEMTRERVQDAVRVRLRSDVPLGVFLSGGLDSSIIAFEASRVVGAQLETFTIATGDALDESEVAQATAQALGVRNTTLPLTVDPVLGVQAVVDHYDQPFADSSAIPSMQVAALAGEHVSVVLNGDGGDELFGGYRRHVAAQRLQRFHAVPRTAALLAARTLGALPGGRRSLPGIGARFARGLSLSAEERYFVFTADMLREGDKQLHWCGPAAAPTERLVTAHTDKRLSYLDQQQLNDIQLNLTSDLLVKMDMACMASSVEGRSPFMDHQLAEFAFALPDDLRVGPRGTTKHALREAYRDLLPEQVINGAKKGFEVPMDRWLASDLRPLLHDVLGSRDARVGSYVDDSVRLGLVSGERYRGRNHGYLLYALLVLELWLRSQERQ